MTRKTLHAGNLQPLSSILRSDFQYFEKDLTHAPEIPSGTYRSLGIDNRQKSEYDLAKLRGFLSSSNNTPLVQVVGDSGTPFEEDKIPEAQALLSYCVDGCMVGYGFTASKHDTNWLVAEYRASHPDMVLIANVVHQSVEALESGYDGCPSASKYLLLFDRLSPTRFGDDVWLSDGIMSRELGDKIICFEGGPQALYQCSNALAKGLQVIVVIGLRAARFSAARLLLAFKNGPWVVEEYLTSIEATPKQLNVARWCLSVLRQAKYDVASLITIKLVS